MGKKNYIVLCTFDTRHDQKFHSETRDRIYRVCVIIFKRQGIRLLREGKKKNKKAYVRKVARLR